MLTLITTAAEVIARNQYRGEPQEVTKELSYNAYLNVLTLTSEYSPYVLREVYNVPE